LIVSWVILDWISGFQSGFLDFCRLSVRDFFRDGRLGLANNSTLTERADSRVVARLSHENRFSCESLATWDYSRVQQSNCIPAGHEW